ncbi:signal peptidase I [Candidatus Parcubacteria bacterium]|nr:signal peptidase I [Candidatus Parcubacteria bacterium]
MKVLKEILWLVLLAVLVVVPIRVFVAQPFVVEGLSMYPTFGNNDYLIVDELSYRFSEPARGDVVIFRYPGNPSVFYVKRIIGLPGEKIDIEKGHVSITREDGSMLVLSEPYVVTEDATYSLSTTLGTDQYFVLGDNRPKSSDSRVWGALPKDHIIGKAYLRVFPVASAAFHPGAVALPQ